MTDLTKKSSYVASLTGVRMLASVMVYIHHYNYFSAENYGSGVYNFFQEFHVGVTMFYVLSGFLIAYRYFYADDFSLGKYLVARFARIFPAFFFLTTVSYLFFCLIKPQEELVEMVNEYLYNIALVKGYYESLKFSGIAQGWSLTVEATFYLAAPFIFLLVRKNTVYLVVIPVVLLVLGLMLSSMYDGRDFMGSSDLFYNYTFFGRSFEFMVGIALAMLYKIKGKLFKANFLTYLGFAIMMFFVYVLSVIKGDMDFGIRMPFGKVINNALLPLFGIGLFYYGLVTEKTYFSKVLSFKPVELLGQCSYIFYLIQMGLFYQVIYRFTDDYFTMFFVLQAFSIFLYFTVEKPYNFYILHMFHKYEKNNKPVSEPVVLDKEVRSALDSN